MKRVLQQRRPAARHQDGAGAAQMWRPGPASSEPRPCHRAPARFARRPSSRGCSLATPRPVCCDRARHDGAYVGTGDREADSWVPIARLKPCPTQSICIFFGLDVGGVASHPNAARSAPLGWGTPPQKWCQQTADASGLKALGMTRVWGSGIPTLVHRTRKSGAPTVGMMQTKTNTSLLAAVCITHYNV